MPRLAIDIEARLASFEQSINKVNQSTSQMASRLESTFGGLRTAFAGLTGILAGGALTALFKNFTDAADGLAKLSQRTGVAVDSLSKLQYAASLSDVSNEQLADGFRKLAVNMQDAARGTGEARDAFRALGISQQQLLTLSPEKAFSLIADKLAGMQDGLTKTNLAVKIFGRSGAELIPLLNSGAAGLRSMGDEAEKLGIVISADTAKAAESFNDNLTRLQSSLRGFGYEIANAVLPSVSDFVGQLVEGQRIFGSFGKAVLELGTVNPFRSLADNIRSTRDEIDRLKKSLESIPASSYRLRSDIQDSLDVAQKRLQFLQFQQRQGIPTGGANTLDARDLQIQEAKAAAAKKAADSAAKSLADADAAIARARKAAAEALRNRKDIEQSLIGRLQEGPTVAGQMQEQRQQDLISRLQAGPVEALRQQQSLGAQVDALLGNTDTSRIENAKRQIDELNDRYLKGTVGLQKYTEARMLLDQQLADLKGESRPLFPDIADEGIKAFDQLKAAIKGWGDQFNETVVQMVKTGKLNFSALVDAALTDLARIAIFQTITQPLLGKALALFPSQGQSGGSGTFTGLQLPGRAAGGPTVAGSAYIVGERGPELFVSPTNGTIIPNSGLGTTNITIAPVINAPVDAAVIRAAVLQGATLATSQMGRAARIGSMS
ncbi:MAG: hypothetical protein GC151_13275 [Betaproteobacteria bacterium]|nr:hypothetical protein [Betaproteobacteria bacterium]